MPNDVRGLALKHALRGLVEKNDVLAGVDADYRIHCGIHDPAEAAAALRKLGGSLFAHCDVVDDANKVIRASIGLADE